MFFFNCFVINLLFAANLSVDIKTDAKNYISTIY
jgi:hypothetical protein